MNRFGGLATVSMLGLAALSGCDMKSDEAFSEEFQKKRAAVVQIVELQGGLTKEMTAAHAVGNTRARTRAAKHHQENASEWRSRLRDFNGYFDTHKARIEKLQLEAGETHSSRDASASAETGIIETTATIERQHYIVDLPPLPDELAEIKVRIDPNKPELVLNGTVLVAGTSMDAVDPYVSSVFGYGDYGQALSASDHRTSVGYGERFQVELDKESRTAYGYTVNTTGPVLVTIVGRSAEMTVDENTDKFDIIAKLGSPDAPGTLSESMAYKTAGHLVRFRFADASGSRLQSVSVALSYR